MNTALHAEAILEAWMFADQGRFQTALRKAYLSTGYVCSTSQLEDERQELLESVVEKLSVLANIGEFPNYSQVSGALTLLRHLSSFPYAQRRKLEGPSVFSINRLKFTGRNDEMLFRSRRRPQG